MRHLWNPFVATISAILIVAYGYLAWRLTSGTGGRIALAVPFAMIWLVPVVYWVGERENKGWVDETVHVASYLCMGWVNFALVLCLARDGLMFATSLLPGLDQPHGALREASVMWVFGGSILALAAGMLIALRVVPSGKGLPGFTNDNGASSIYRGIGCQLP